MIKIEREDIERLNSVQLALLLGTLLFQEAKQNAIPASCVYASSKICVSDGGEDGRVKWESGVQYTDYFPKQFVVFQSTVTKMDNNLCKNKILTKDKQTLQPRIEEVLDAGGTYVLFFNHDCNTQHQPPLIDGFRAALRQTGKTYADNADIHIYDSNRIAQWANQYLSAISQICEWVGKCPPDGLVTWNMWERYRDDSIEYVADEVLKAALNQLRQHLSSSRQTARIIGLSGLGKTRLALETFRPLMAPDGQSHLLADGVAYIKNPIENQLPATVSNWRCQKSSGILVVDNCPLTLHKKLYDEIRHLDSRMSLLTLGSNPDEIISYIDGDYRYIKIERAADSVIEGMVYKIYPQLPKEEAARVVAFSQGFPLMAVLIGGSIQKGNYDFTKLFDNDLTQKLLGPEADKDPNMVKAIRGCAIFDYIAEDQYPFVEKTICGLGDNEFYRAIKHFEKRGIISRVNHLIRVIPKPLALRLAASWWEGCSPAYFSKVIDTIPEGLVKPLCEQIIKLEFLPQAQQITERLCGPQYPFGSAEVLDTEKGSLLFRALVEVNPKATADALVRIYSQMPNEQLLQVKRGRRNLVWALEKLAFRKKTFSQAAMVLLSFASAENESWGNSATGQLLQLFHVVLSGTEANLEQRTTFLSDALQTTCVHKNNVIIKVLGEALATGPFHRINGPEYQGAGQKLEEYYPKTNKEVYEYLRGCLNRLTNIAIGTSEHAIKARLEISKRIFGLTFKGMANEVETALSQISNAVDGYCPEMYFMIREIIKRADGHLTELQLLQVKRWLNLFEPTTLPGKLEMFVSRAQYDMETIAEGERRNVTEIRADNLANECAASTDVFYRNLRIVYSGEQNSGYSFGRSLGRALSNKIQFIDESLGVLESLSGNGGEPIVLTGFLSIVREMTPELLYSTLDRMEANSRLDRYVNEILRVLRTDEILIGRIVARLKNSKIDLEELNKFTYGCMFDELPVSVVCEFCMTAINTHPNSSRIVLDILYMYSFRNKERYRECMPTFRAIIMIKDIFQDENAVVRDYYHWQLVCTDLLTTKDDELALHAASEIVQSGNCDRLVSHFDSTFHAVLCVLMKEYSHIVWREFWKGLTSEDYRFKHNVIDMLKGHIDGFESDKRIIASMPREFFCHWLTDNADVAPKIFAHFIPILYKNDNDYEWHEYALHMIDNYGNDKEMLGTLFYSMGPDIYSGSGIPIYQKKIELFARFLQHSNPNVKIWANDVIDYLNQQIVREQREEAEDEFTGR